MDYPKLRHLDIFPFESSGKKAIGLRDPAGMNDRIVVVSYPAFFIISLFDGKRSLLDIRAEYMRKFKEMIFTEQLEEIVKQLDENYLLDNDRYQAYRAHQEEEFRNAEVRVACFAGKSYEGDPRALTARLDGFFTAPPGPGSPRPGNKGDYVKGIIAPHIDFQRGGPCYAWAYKELAESPPPELFIILGTVHLPTHNPFILTRKKFDTPLGVLDNASDLVDALAGKLSFDPYQDEILHRTEHTIEFQAVFLSHLFRDTQRFRILPILCGSFHEVVSDGITPLQKPHLSDFVTHLRTTVCESGYRGCYIASADLAHVGIRFGASAAPSPASLRDIEQQDRSMLSYAERLDAQGFCAFIQKEKDRRNICGLPPVYTMLSAMDAREGKLLDYRQSVEPGGGSVVTFASMVFR